VYVPTGRRRSTFMARTGTATIYSRIVCWRWMRPRASGSGTFNLSGTMCGTATCPRRRRWCVCGGTDAWWTRWRRSPSLGSFLFLTGTRGKSLFPIEEREVAPSDVDGELLARQQPLPLAPAPFARQEVTEELLTRRTPEAHAEVRERFRKLRSGPQFTPPSFEGTIIFPGFDGGGEWGGAAFDPAKRLLFVNSNEMAWVLRLVPRTRRPAGARALYLRDCSSCHRPDLKGTPPQFPALTEHRRETERSAGDDGDSKRCGPDAGVPELER
jgi:mono/diheme cytochrome c family protein